MFRTLTVLRILAARALRELEASWFDSAALTASWHFGCCL